MVRYLGLRYAAVVRYYKIRGYYYFINHIIPYLIHDLPLAPLIMNNKLGMIPHHDISERLLASILELDVDIHPYPYWCQNPRTTISLSISSSLFTWQSTSFTSCLSPLKATTIIPPLLPLSGYPSAALHACTRTAYLVVQISASVSLSPDSSHLEGSAHKPVIIWLFCKLQQVCISFPTSIAVPNWLHSSVSRLHFPYDHWQTPFEVRRLVARWILLSMLHWPASLHGEKKLDSGT